jgi:hypothetical protein
MKIQSIPPLRPFSACHASGTPRMLVSLLSFLLLLLPSFLVLIPKNELEVGVTAHLFLNLKI